MTVTAGTNLVRQPAPARLNQLTGEVVYIYAFDIAYEMSRFPVKELLGQPVAQFVVDASKRSPKQLFFYRPQMVRLPPMERLGPRGPMRIERTVKMLPVGAISITVRVPFSVKNLDELVPFHDLRFNDGSYLYDEVRALAEEVRQQLRPHLIRPVDKLGDEEAYTVFCINGPLTDSGGGAAAGGVVPAEDWLHVNRREVAALLTEEPDPAHLSEQEALESTGKYYSYYERDIVVLDWDAALVIDEPRDFDEVLYIMELANLQLAELEAYDRILDDAVDRSYRDLSIKRFGGLKTPPVQRELREIRVDLARLSDELSNITKFFGDWHRIIDEKLKTLDNLYQILRSDQNNRMMLLLEFTIVLLFVIDLIVIAVGMGK